MHENADKLIVHAHLFTMQGDGVGYVADGAVAVRGDRIAAVGPTADLAARYRASETIDATDCAVLPGLIDAHMHTPLAIVRGVAQDVAHWMQRALAPYSRHITPEAALAGTRLNVLEALKAGTTTMVDYTRPIPGWADVFQQAGVRARLTPTINALPPGGMAGWKLGDLYPLDPAAGQASIDDAVAFARDWHGAAEGRITVMLGPQAPDMLPREQLLEVKRIAGREGLMIHMHVAQGDREIDQMLKRYGQRTPAYLDSWATWTSSCWPCTSPRPPTTRRPSSPGAARGMALCSGSIGIIDGIVPPAHAFRAAGGLVALGSDQASGNNCNNIFNEMKLTALFNKIQLPRSDRHARLGGAAHGHHRGRAGDRPGRRGRLAGGGQAGRPDPGRSDGAQPVAGAGCAGAQYRAQPGLCRQRARGQDGDGRRAGAGARRAGADRRRGAIRAEAQAQAEAIARRVAADPVHKGMALLEAMEAGQL